MQVSQNKTTTRSFTKTPVAAGIVIALASPALMAQEGGIEEVVVTAQKREQSLQDVPISIQTLGNAAIEELNLNNFKEYTEMLPSVAIQQSLGAGSSFNQVYMRGISTGQDGQATTSLPSVGMYLDELPITTIQGNLDIHMYDIARVEALAGPQGTLYGASSQAGTLRVITNQPDFDEYSASLTAGANTVDEGGTGFKVEGHLNVPISDNAAIRLVGWHRDDAGWIDNVLGSRTFPGVENQGVCDDAGVDCSADDITITNEDKAKKDYNTLETTGARAALRVDLNDNWTISPTVMFQTSESRGSWADDLSDILQSGDYAVTHFKDEFFDDEWGMVGLTIEGTVGNFDVVYAGSYLDRQVEGSTDYSDYSYWYDTIYTTGYYADIHFSGSGFRSIPNQFEGILDDPPGTRSMTGSAFTNDDRYTKTNHELRISTDQEARTRAQLGVFVQKQFHDFEQLWEVEGGVAPEMQFDKGANPKFRDTVYLNSMFRIDRDFALFGSVSHDVTDNVEITAGLRYFEPEVHVKGFFGFPEGYQRMWGTDGETQCDAVVGGDGPWDDGATADFNGQEDFRGKPCLNVDKRQEEDDTVGRFNVTWNVSDDSMVYFTWSEGYRPGGIQRRPTFGEYESDFLTNIEFGWKTQFADNRVQLNGALFTQNWEDIQISFTGENAITQVNNGPEATVDGLEVDLLWLPTDNLRITAAAAFYDSQINDPYCCEDVGPDGEAGTSDDINLADKGTKLPVTSDFKGNLVARYSFEAGNFDSYIQGAMIYEGERDSALDRSINEALGVLPSYTKLDLAAGIARDQWSLDLFIANATGADETTFNSARCATGTCGSQVYGVRLKPRTIGLQFRQDFD